MDKIASKAFAELDNSRPMDLSGASRNPEYIVGLCRTSFIKTKNGKRVAPVSQLNTWTGRMLAKEDLLGSNVRAESSVSSGTNQHTTSLTQHTLDRDLLPPQRPRNGLSRCLSMNRGSSRKGTTQGQKHAKETNTEAKTRNVTVQVTALVTSPSVPAANTVEMEKKKAVRRKEAVSKRSSSNSSDGVTTKSSVLDLWEEAGMSDSMTRPLSSEEVPWEEEVLVMLDPVGHSKQIHGQYSDTRVLPASKL
jgi:hypothetical protein